MKVSSLFKKMAIYFKGKITGKENEKRREEREERRETERGRGTSQ